MNMKIGDMINFKTYRLKKRFYNSTDEIKVTIPENVKFVYDDGAVGVTLYTGHNHYLGFIRKSDYDYDILDYLDEINTFIDFYEFGDELIARVIDTILPIDDLPIYTYQEMTKEFELDKYYVYYRFFNDFDEKYGDFLEVIKNPDIDINELIIPGKYFKAIKIKTIEGPYSVTTFEIYSDVKDNTFCMDLKRFVYIDALTNDASTKFKIIVTKDPSIFEELKNEVLSQIDN